MRWVKELFLALVIGVVLAFMLIYLGFLIPELWELIEDEGMDFVQIRSEFDYAWHNTKEILILPVTLSALIAVGFFTLRYYRNISQWISNLVGSNQ